MKRIAGRLLLPLVIALAVAAGSPPGQAAPAAPAASAPATIRPASGTYALDPDHTDVLAQWSHFGFSQPSAHFAIRTGTLVYDAADVTRSSVQVVLPIARLETFVGELNERLKSSGFFDAGAFPDAVFKSTRVVAAGPGRLTVTGNLTIKNITRPVVLAVTLNGAGEHPMLKKQAIGFSATTTLKRTDFGIGAYAPAVSDEVRLRITTEGTLVDAPPAAKPQE